MLQKGIMFALILVGVVGLERKALAQTIIYVNHNASGDNSGSSWSDAFVSLQDGLAAAKTGDEIWIAQGTYRPDRGNNVALGDRNASFDISAGVALYGGFDTSESNRGQRDWVTHQTILSGDLLGNDTGDVAFDEPSRFDNSMHVVHVGPHSESLTIDGVIVQDGHAWDSSVRYENGGGLQISGPATLANILVRYNTAELGAGLSIDSGPENIIEFKASRIENNEAEFAGGGIYGNPNAGVFSDIILIGNRALKAGGGGFYVTGNLRMKNSVFESNSSGEGGGLYLNDELSLFLVNTVFVSNEADWSGGAVYLEETPASFQRSVTVSNSLFSGNSAQEGGAIYTAHVSITTVNSTFYHNLAEMAGGAIFHSVRGSTVRLENCILWQNYTGTLVNSYSPLFHPELPGGDDLSYVETSLIEGGLPIGMADDGLTIDLDPMFLDPLGMDGIAGTQDDNLRLSSTSPAINTGQNSLVPSDSLDLDEDGILVEPLPLDLDLHPRVYGPAPGSSTIDLGAYEYGDPALGIRTVTAVNGARGAIIVGELFPNPTLDSVRITYSLLQGSEVFITLHDTLGRKKGAYCRHYTSANTKESCTINLVTYAAGSYFLTIQTSFGRKSVPLVIQ